MFYVVYVSSAVRPWTDAELLALLHQSRTNNERLGITGALLYKGGNFMQVLEGPEMAVREQVAKIEQDSRHAGFLKLLQGRTEAPLFPEWTMGFVPTTQLTTEDNAAVDSFLRTSSDCITSNASSDVPPALKLLLSFKKHMR